MCINNVLMIQTLQNEVGLQGRRKGGMGDNLLRPSFFFEEKRKWQYCMPSNLKLQKLAKALMSLLEAGMSFALALQMQIGCLTDVTRVKGCALFVVSVDTMWWKE